MIHKNLFHTLFSIVLLTLTFCKCSSSPESSLEEVASITERELGSDFSPENETDTYKVLFFQLPNQKRPISKQEALNTTEHYRIMISSKTGLIMREEHFRRNYLNGHIIFLYDSNNKLERMVFYNNQKQKTKEKIFKKHGTIVLKYTYSHQKTLIQKSEFLDGKRNGLWSYYNLKEQPSRLELYKKGILKKTWVPEYNDAGEKINETIIPGNVMD